MGRTLPWLAAALLITGATAPVAFADGGLYGTIVTDDGERFTGAIRWDKNENYWDNLLDASKQDKVKQEGSDDGVDLKILGFQIRKSGSKDSHWVQSQFSIPMGHIESIEPGRGDKVRIEIKNGLTVEIKEGADAGGSMRGIVIEDEDEGEIELDWDDIEKVTFSQAPRDLDRDRERLHGVVETEVGDFTGFVVWDRDEALGRDILDGDENGRGRKIEFSRIASIERLGSWGSLVTLTGGREMELEDSNDVDDDNRGIEVTIEDLGKVDIPWKHFERVTFTDAPRSPAYDEFDGGHELRGTVVGRDGERVSGTIVWDLDERYSWESLDGNIRDVEFTILFQHITRVTPTSHRAARVTLTDGLELELKGSNDVNDGNKGVVVIGNDGLETLFMWDDIEYVSFE